MLAASDYVACSSEMRRIPAPQPVEEEEGEDASIDVASPVDAAQPQDAGAPDAQSTTTSPCGVVPVEGACTASNVASTCVVPTGQGSPRVVSEVCPTFAECKVVQGRARCSPKAGQCLPGASECVSASSRRMCDSNGLWSAEVCPGCRATSFGALCSGKATTTSYSGTVRYETRGPNASYTDWGSLVTVPAIGVLVVSYAWDAASGSYTPIDATTADSTGNYTVAVPTPGDPKDLLNVWAVRTTAAPSRILFALAHPDVPDGEWDVARPVPVSGANANWWGWGQYVQALGPSGSVFDITEPMGSGALRVFDYLRYSYDTTAALLGASGKSVVVWIRSNTSWSCGACAVSWPTSFMGQAFESQIWIPALAQDTSWWADPVTAHELGHWVMSSYGASPNEGGPHRLACPTFPGQAWSEGWATAFSSLARANSVYYDKQKGTFFWFDVAAEQYGSGDPWSPPTAAGGLGQLMDENVVASLLWHLADNPTQPGALGANASLLRALVSERMTKRPFARGYTTRRWEGACEPRSNVVDTSVSAPMVADYLDALRCSGMPASKIASAIGAYPYPVSAPLCK